MSLYCKKYILPETKIISAQKRFINRITSTSIKAYISNTQYYIQEWFILAIINICYYMTIFVSGPEREIQQFEWFLRGLVSALPDRCQWEV